MIQPPPGVVSDQSTLSTTVNAGTVALQFNLYDAGGTDPSVGLNHTLTHRGITESLSTLVQSLLSRPPSGDTVGITRCQGSSVYSTRWASWVYIYDPATLSYRSNFSLRRKPSSLMALSSGWGYATCSP